MSISRPREVVVIREISDLALRPRAADAAFSDHQRRELVELMEALKCDVRQRALETLATGEAVPVGQLARRMGVAQPTVSNHLNILRRMGLLHTRRAGRCIEYQCAPGLVRLEQFNGKLTLPVSRPSGATVTLAATMPA